MLFRSCNAKSPARQQNSNGCSGLEHLDEGNREIEVCHVSANKTQTEEDTNGHDGSQVDAASHLDILTAVQDIGGASENLGHEGSKGQVPCCENNCCEVLDTTMGIEAGGYGDIRKPEGKVC